MLANDKAQAPDQAPRPFVLANIRKWTFGEWGAILVVAGFFVFLKMWGAPSDIETQQLRAQFHLPDDVVLTKVQVNRSNTKPFAAPIEGYVQFRDPEFQRFIAKLDDASTWRPVPIIHGGMEFHGIYSSDALIWRDIRNSPPMSWGSLSWKQAQDARNGRILCFVLTEDGNGTHVFRGEQCRPGRPASRKTVYVRGLIDYDTRTLHMLIGQTRPELP